MSLYEGRTRVEHVDIVFIIIDCECESCIKEMRTLMRTYCMRCCKGTIIVFLDEGGGGVVRRFVNYNVLLNVVNLTILSSDSLMSG